MPLRVGEHRERLVVGRARIAHRMRQAAHRFDVLREHVQAAVDDRLDVAQHALEIRRQRLDRGVGIESLDLADAGGEMRRAAVGQVVAIDRGEHHVLQLISCTVRRGVGRLLRIEPAARIAGVHGAEAAGARAHLAHQHDRGRAGVPAFTDVRALGFLAHRGEPMLAHRLPDRVEPRPAAPPAVRRSQAGLPPG